MGNNISVRKVLTEVLGYSMQKLMDALCLVGADQLLATQIRSLQRIIDGDIPCEDFSVLIILLRPLHTLLLG